MFKVNYRPYNDNNNTTCRFLICVGYKDGVVELFNFMRHRLVKRLDLRSQYTFVEPPDEDSINCSYDITVPDLSVTCLQYSPSGEAC